MRNVLACSRTQVPLGKAEINKINSILFLSRSNRDVFGFDVSVNVACIVQKLQPLNALTGDHAHCSEGEPALTEVKQLLKTRA